MQRKDVDEVLVAADVVGVFSGKISRQAEGADHVMVVSVRPIVLGNMPPDGEEEGYEKVAFMGQVPVRVRGIVQEGDFLVPGGWEDGTAVGVNPAHIRPDQLDRVIGVAWESSYAAESLVNMAVGLRNTDIARVVQTQYTQLTETSLALESLQDENAALKEALAKLDADMDVMSASLEKNERQSKELMRLLEVVASQIDSGEGTRYEASVK
ncbi:MAG: hypothetical protein DHS20C12_06450 [Pseudohongiella sp.]|nr:MAG: hypothetical protein DHS20C12_06450 [Pseudohongiella sp.]